MNLPGKGVFLFDGRGIWHYNRAGAVNGNGGSFVMRFAFGCSRVIVSDRHWSGGLTGVCCFASHGVRNMKYLLVSGLLFSSVLGVSGCGKSVEIIAHRGASYLAPENTLTSVMLGWEKGADVEVDVHISKDDRVVVIHDASTKRVGGADMKVVETTAEELRELDCGSFKGPEFAGEKMPFLADVLATIPPRRKLYVEIKCGREVLPVLRQLIADSGKMSQIVIIGFDLETVTASKELIDVPTYWLRGTKKVEETEEWIPHDPSLVQTVIENGLDGLDVHYAGVTQEFVDAAKAAGQKLYVWTVDDPEEANRLVGLGVSGITTNRPEWLRERIEN